MPSENPSSVFLDLGISTHGELEIVGIRLFNLDPPPPVPAPILRRVVLFLTTDVEWNAPQNVRALIGRLRESILSSVNIEATLKTCMEQVPRDPAEVELYTRRQRAALRHLAAVMRNQQNHRLIDQRIQAARTEYLQHNWLQYVVHRVRDTDDINQIHGPINSYRSFREFASEEELRGFFTALSAHLSEHRHELEERGGAYDPATSDPETLDFWIQLWLVHKTIVQTLQCPRNPPPVVVPPVSVFVLGAMQEMTHRILLHDARRYAIQEGLGQQRRMAVALGSHPRLGMFNRFLTPMRWRRSPG